MLMLKQQWVENITSLSIIDPSDRLSPIFFFLIYLWVLLLTGGVAAGEALASLWNQICLSGAQHLFMYLSIRKTALEIIRPGSKKHKQRVIFFLFFRFFFLWFLFLFYLCIKKFYKPAVFTWRTCQQSAWSYLWRLHLERAPRTQLEQEDWQSQTSSLERW